MDTNEIKDIMDIAAKLEASFRHIKYLCGKYEEMEKGTTNFQPYNSYHPYMPPNYNPMPPNYPHDPYYHPQYNPTYVYPAPHLNPHYPPMAPYPINRTQQVKEATNKIQKPQENQQKPSLQKKKLQTNNLNSNQKKSMVSNEKINGFKQIKSLQSKPLPQSSYHVFLDSKKNQIKNEYPHLQEQQLLEIMMEVWKSFTQNQKRPYQLQFKRLKQNHLESTNNKHSQSNKQKPV